MRQIPQLSDPREIARLVTERVEAEQINRKSNRKHVTPSHKSEFPVNAIGGAAGRFADVYSSYLESAWEFLAMVYLTILGALIAHRITIKSQIHPQPRLYMILVGRSADDRKSEAIRQVVNFFIQCLQTINNSVFKIDLCQGLGSAEGLATKFSGSPILLVYDELKSFVNKAQIEGSILLQCVCSLFESNVFHSSTKKNSISLDDVYLSLLGASTLETYQRMWTPAFLDIGFINRLFVIIGSTERKFAIPRKIPDAEKAPLRNDLQDILVWIESLAKDGTYELPIDDDADKLFESWYLSQEQSKVSKRLDTYGHRLLILLAANEKQERITVGVVQKVIDLLDWQKDIRRIIDPIDGETLIAKIECSIKGALANGTLTKRELERKCHKDRYGTYYWKMATQGLIGDKEILFKKNTFYLNQGQEGE